jgi:hypothetical protein
LRQRAQRFDVLMYFGVFLRGEGVAAVGFGAGQDRFGSLLAGLAAGFELVDKGLGWHGTQRLSG